MTSFIRSILHTGYKELGDSYINGIDETETANYYGAVAYLKHWIKEEYEQYSKTYGIQFVDYDPYESFEHLYYDLKVNMHLNVFSGGSDSKLFGNYVNLMFRAIHDIHHFESGHGFETWEGEVMAFAYAIERLPATSIQTYTDAVSILFSEIVLQASAFYVLGEFPSTQKVVYV